MDPTIGDVTTVGGLSLAAMLSWLARSLLTAVRDYLKASAQTKAAAVEAFQDLAAAAHDYVDVVSASEGGGARSRRSRRPRSTSGPHPTLAEPPPPADH